MLKERPILFSGEMVRAILGGRKTQTRRVVKDQPEFGVQPCHYSDTGWAETHERGTCKCTNVTNPYGNPGERLWVRESFTPRYFDDGRPAYKADWTSGAAEYVKEPKWKPSIHIPRYLSRINLEITNVRVERLNEISEEDAKAEGVEALSEPIFQCMCEERCTCGGPITYRNGFESLWYKINGKKHPWSSNPWVWVIEFRRV
jgi:hypothetical protein